MLDPFGIDNTVKDVWELKKEKKNNLTAHAPKIPWINVWMNSK